ncbi:TetR family transcriptional regulator [Occultella gossypii]|uniref:TetR family transcriptional regulator n=1 Tax=Occultella gossypii TaxID=2800820 RepID=A0ABS7SE26_9MICO|nr:TetR family transcriptional regulator [Occultella gossypii]MBZ2198502.1 TetR family transcriptional regulator [Occultella gossypii]
MSTTGESLRQRTRRAVRAEIVEAAMELFLSRGFDETTVEEIAQSAGISRRSYFRYFASKDEVLAGGLASIGAAIAQSLEARPDTESAWLALRRAFDPIVRQADADPRAEALGRLMLQHPGLQREKDSTWANTIAKALALRLPSDHRTTIQVDALVASAIACLHVAQEHWLRPGERVSLSALLDKTMKAVRPFE